MPCVALRTALCPTCPPPGHAQGTWHYHTHGAPHELGPCIQGGPPTHIPTPPPLLPPFLPSQFTGYVQGMNETFQKTPVMAQLETKDPEPVSFLHTRNQVPYKTTHVSSIRDPCNKLEIFQKEEPDNLWPRLQTTAKQPSAKPPVSSIALGDQRIDTFRTMYGGSFTPPFAGGRWGASPVRRGGQRPAHIAKRKGGGCCSAEPDHGRSPRCPVMLPSMRGAHLFLCPLPAPPLRA